jgi:hypothetical protein
MTKEKIEQSLSLEIDEDKLTGRQSVRTTFQAARENHQFAQIICKTLGHSTENAP